MARDSLQHCWFVGRAVQRPQKGDGIVQLRLCWLDVARRLVSKPYLASAPACVRWVAHKLLVQIHHRRCRDGHRLRRAAAPHRLVMHHRVQHVCRMGDTLAVLRVGATALPVDGRCPLQRHFCGGLLTRSQVDDGDSGLPQTGVTPQAVPLVGRLPLAKCGGHVPLGSLRAHHPHDTAEDGAMILSRSPARSYPSLHGQQQGRSRCLNCTDVRFTSGPPSSAPRPLSSGPTRQSWV
jgi:hypothetical protein